MRQPLTPFPLTGYYGPEYFCNRAKEKDALIQYLKGGMNITLASLRRVGKTGLIHHAFYFLEKDKNWNTIYADIYATSNFNQFLETLSSAILSKFPEKTVPGQKFMTFIKSLRPTITFDPLSGQPEITLTALNEKDRQMTFKGIMEFLSQVPGNLAIAIDEFQQIAAYPETNVEAILRTEIQQLKNVFFVFSGSEQHLLNDIFTNPSKPFFSSTSLMSLDKLDPEEYSVFVRNKFIQSGRRMGEEEADFMIEWTRGHTFYTQFLANRIFITQKKKITLADIKEEIQKMLKEQENGFYNIRNLITKAQWDLLKAIAKEKTVFHPQSGDFISKHKLGQPSTVNRSLMALLEKELIYKTNSDTGEVLYEVYNVFLSRWLEYLK